MRQPTKQGWATLNETEKRDLAVVILAGGAGTRFWPLSTESRPKQFLRLLGDTSLLQQAFERAQLLVPPERILVLTSETLIPAVMEDLPAVLPDNLISEPVRRDTAAALCLAAIVVLERWGEVVLVTLTADHYIEPPSAFTRAVLSAVRAARAQHAIYTFGIRPTHPSTAFGYLEHGPVLFEDDGITHRTVLTFREKPDERTAQLYLASSNFSWNSGMFVWSLQTFLVEAEQHIPRHLEVLAPAARQIGTVGGRQALAAAFAVLPAISIDFALMEKSSCVRMVSAPFCWDDLGGWLALEKYLPSDGSNYYHGRLLTHSAINNLVFSEDPEEIVALLGVDGLVVVRAGSRTLVMDRQRAEELRRLVQNLETE